MKKLQVLCLILLVFSGCKEKMRPIDYVDPMIGTGYHAHTYPGATMPYGMVQLSPDSRVGGWDACSGYHYSDSTILGFSHTHLSGTGCADFSDILFYPSVEQLVISDGLYGRPAHRFSHEDESASPGYYSVLMDGGSIKAELTATERTGVHRYTFRDGSARQILIDLLHSVADGEKVTDCGIYDVSDNGILGYRVTDAFVQEQHIYFSARFSEPFTVEIVDGKQALLTFAPDIKELTVVVALSPVSCDNAVENGLVEVPELDFEKVRQLSRSAWERELGDIIVEGNRKEKVNFYTAVYHTKVCPNLMNDVNGQYRRHDGTVGTVPQGKSYYSTLSLWDTFRAWNPLQTLIDTELVNDMIFSMLEMYRSTGELPIWPLSSGETDCMIGYHSFPVIADAYMKGIGDFDADYALDAMIVSSNANSKGSEHYINYGYLPSDKARESVSVTLEFAYDDWTLALMAEEMGRKEVAEEYYSRAASYKNLFDGSTGFFRGKNSDGNWVYPFDTDVPGRDYTEGTPWHYRFFVPHDIKGLVQCFGSEDAFIKALDNLFTLESTREMGVSDITGLMGQYAHGNEPSHHMAYLYSYVGQPWKTQYYTRELLDVMYDPVPGGIIGNEDAGQMSAWYILSSLGFYQVCPGSDEFILTSPLFEEAELRLANGKSLKIKANNPEKNRYIKEVILNGRVIDVPYVTYGQLMEGGVLKFVMDSKPDMKDGASQRPYSMSEKPFVAAPYTNAATMFFDERIQVDLNSATPGTCIRYTLDGTEPSEKSVVYTGPFVVAKSCEIKATAYKEGYEPSKVSVINAVKAEYLPSVSFKPSANGVRYRYYEGEFALTGMIEKSPVVSKGVLPEPSLDFVEREDHFGIVFEGYIDVPEKGVWEFYTRTDDGSVLFIDGVEVVYNDGGHSAITAIGRIALDKGFHPYKLLYFEDYEGQELSWAWKAPGKGDFSSIPSNVLYY